jgi:hypothetical protein
MYGLIGLFALGSVLFLPVMRTAWLPAQVSDPPQSNLRQVLVVVILMVAFDALLNGAMILPYLLLMAGLTTKAAIPKA